MKFNLRRFIVMLIGVLMVGAICISCTPEEYEYFKKGYYAGSTGDYSDL